MTNEKRPKVLIAKLGLDAHWRGAMVVTRVLCDAGMEVVFVGNQRPEAIVNTALQEDVDVVGLSSLSGNHMTLAPKVARLLRERSSRVPVILGGTVPEADLRPLARAGIREVFGPGTPLERIVERVRSLAT